MPQYNHNLSPISRSSLDYILGLQEGNKGGGVEEGGSLLYWIMSMYKTVLYVTAALLKEHINARLTVHTCHLVLVICL